jgi:lipid-binding SYLF domain-containing protein
MRNLNSLHVVFIVAVLALSAAAAHGQSSDDAKLSQAAAVLHNFTADEANGIPVDLLQRARGIAVIPNVIRGGFLVGGRRGRGVLIVRTPSGGWSNPAFITLTGGSIGLQFGAEAMDVVLLFANDRSVKNIASGRFTLGGDASAVAGPLGRRNTAAVTGRSEVYVYVKRARGAFAGATFEGARLDVDEDGNALFYAAANGAHALGEQSYSTPQSALRFLESVQTAAALPPATPGYASPAHGATRPQPQPAQEEEEAVIYPLEGPAP